MTTLDLAHLINLLGWTTGFALYAMLLAMALRLTRQRRAFGVSGNRVAKSLWSGADGLPLATAILGLIWNAGALATHGLRSLRVAPVDADVTVTLIVLLGAASVAALGFLPAVVVHAVMRNSRAETKRRRAFFLIFTAYALSSVAAAMHLIRAVTSNETHSAAGLYVLTFGFIILMAGLFASTRGEPGWRRAVWAAALAVFAVSAVHLSSSTHEANHELWYLELVGHHASLPLALAILYQDYRFAFADLFLKRALTLLSFVALVTSSFLIYAVWLAPLLTTGAQSFIQDNPIINVNPSALNVRSVGVLLALWVTTGMVYPRLQQWTNWLIETVVLRRVDYTKLRAEIAEIAHATERWEVALDAACARLAPALSAHEVYWRVIKSTRDLSSDAKDASENIVVQVPVTDAPLYEIVVGELTGGRRLLSDDIEMLEAIAIILARRIDALRVTHERCEQLQREQEIAKLASEAQLRALRAQINPHFLFNALTTIGYLIQASPARALETLMRLTDLLRRVLRAGGEWTTLGEELKLIEAYLDIERARFEERLQVRVNVAPELHTLRVPSFIVQPLVENSIKHGIAPLRAGGTIEISARLDVVNQTLLIIVRDTGAGASVEMLKRGKTIGVGLVNTEARLRALCGDAAQLKIDTEAGAGAVVRIEIPVRVAAAAMN